MFRHKKKPGASADENQEPVKEKPKKKKKAEVAVEQSAERSTPTDGSIKELLEKNLKWSQIIYEQNRKMNRHLMWSAVANWLKLFIILAPLILAILYLPPIVKDVWSRFGFIGSSTSQQSGALENIIEVFKLSPEQQSQLKTILNK